MAENEKHRVDEFFDYRVIGIADARAGLDVFFDWSIETPQIEYPYDLDISAAIRETWHPLPNQLYLYWRRKLTDLQRIPDRADLDPLMEIPTLCPYLCIFEDIRDRQEPSPWFCRMMGTHVEEILGKALTNRLASGFIEEPNHPQAARFARVVDGPMISYRCGEARTYVETRFGRAASIYLPITDKRRGVKAAFGGAAYQWLKT